MAKVALVARRRIWALAACLPAGASCAVLALASISWAPRPAVTPTAIPGDRDFSTGPPDDPGAPIFKTHCAACHEHAVDHAPAVSILTLLSPAAIERILTTGPMRVQAEGLSDREKRLVAEYLSGKKGSAASPNGLPPPCRGQAAAFDFGEPPAFSGWGLTPGNKRLIDAPRAGVSKQNVGRLRLKWAFGFPDAVRARSEPALAGGAIYVGSNDGTVFALDRETGCRRWSFQADAEVRTGVVISPWSRGDRTAQPRAYFGDLIGNLYAVDAKTGALVWRDKPDQHPSVTITAAPALYRGRLYAPFSSLEEAIADPKYECCTFRGSVVAYDATSGKRLWQTFMTDAPRLRGRNAAGARMFGPSGAAIWSSPTVDAKRNRLYVATGDNYSSPVTAMSDAIVSLDMTTGRAAWTFQATAGDAFNGGCSSATNTLCPKENGPDFDFGAPPILTKRQDGREILLAGQKSGTVYAVDPDTAKLVWSRKVGRGGLLAGVYFGMAVAGDRLFVPVSDLDDGRTYPEPPHPGLYALDITTGRGLWAAPAAANACEGRLGCAPGIGAAITATSDLVLTGGDDGWLQIWDARTGRIVWRFDTEQSFPSIGGGTVKGGSVGGGAGPIAFDGLLIVESGYGFAARAPGNALLVFDSR